MGQRKPRFIFKTCLMVIILSFIVLSVTAITNAGEYEDNVNNEGYDKNTSLDVQRERISFDALLKWTPESDPDAKYNRASVPLRTGRFYGPQVNPNATPGAKIQHWAMISTCGAQGSQSFGNYAFTHWQYLDTLVGWAETKGTIVCPTADIVDAAHRNGVPITAGVFFGGGANPYGQSQIKELTTKVGNRYPVIDKMAQLATFYGFDGFSFNQETSGAQKYLHGFFNAMRYARLNYPQLIFNWYDSMTSSTGDISYQDGLNVRNKLWFIEDNELKSKGALKPYLMDDIFSNYNWTPAKVDNSVQTAIAGNRSPYDVYHSFEMQGRGFSEEFRLPYALDNAGKLKTSLGFYCADAATMGPLFHDQENRLWSSKKTVDANIIYDPRQAGDDWGMANYVLDKSIINRLPFNSNFNTGHGYKTYIDGEVACASEWFNRGLTSITPTWTWIVDTDASKKLRVGYDFTCAFNGGNSVKYWGKLINGKNYDAKIFSTRLASSKPITFRITVKANVVAANILGLISRGLTTYNWTEKIALNKVANVNGWQVLEGVIPAGEMINGLGFSLQATQDTDRFTFHLGQMQLYQKQVPLRKARAPRLARIMHFDNYAEARVEAPKLKNAEFYELWLKYGATTKLLKVSPNPNLFVHRIELPKGINNGQLFIIPVDINGNRRPELVSPETTFTFYGRYASVYNPGVNMMHSATPIAWTSKSYAMEPNCIIDGNYTWNPRISTKDRDIWICFDLGKTKQMGMARLLAQGDIGSHAHGKHINDLDSEDLNPLSYEIYYSNSAPTGTGHLGSAASIPSSAKLCAKVANSATAAEVCVKLGNYDLLGNINYEPVSGRYVYLRIFDIPTSHSHWNLRLCEFELFPNSTLPKTITIDPADISVERVSAHSANITFKNVPFNSEITLYNENGVVLMHKKQSVFKPYDRALYTAWRNRTLKITDTVHFENITMKQSASKFYYSIKNTLLDSSSNIEIPYSGVGAPMTADISASQLQFAPYKISTRYARGTLDGAVYSLTITGLLPGTVIKLNQSGLYQRVDTVVANSNGVAFFDWVFVDKNKKITLHATGYDQQPWAVAKIFNVS